MSRPISRDWNFFRGVGKSKPTSHRILRVAIKNLRPGQGASGMLYLLIDLDAHWWLTSGEGLTFEINGIDLSPMIRTKVTMQTESVATI